MKKLGIVFIIIFTILGIVAFFMISSIKTDFSTLRLMNALNGIYNSDTTQITDSIGSLFQLLIVMATFVGDLIIFRCFQAKKKE